MNRLQAEFHRLYVRLTTAVTRAERSNVLYLRRREKG